LDPSDSLGSWKNPEGFSHGVVQQQTQTYLFDFDGDGIVGGGDLGLMLLAWGDC
jgi:hypothetical protein